jgi:hypothetical protein
MFKRNEQYRQTELFGLINNMSNKQNKMLVKSIEYSFFMNIFVKIKEGDFKVLYSEKKSRPNAPVNQLVASLIIKHLFNWTYEELFKRLNFDVLTRYAVGIRTIEEEVFSEATLYNFQNKIISHFVTTGTDLLKEVFDALTSAQLSEFGIKTNIQRGDSFLIGSNIIDYTRLQLLIEVLHRIFRVLDDNDKSLYHDTLNDYTKQTSGQYIYKLPKEDLPTEIQKLAGIYHELYIKLKERYAETAIFKVFTRVYTEHFVIVNKKVEVVPSEKLTSSILMSPDDESATFRRKRDQDSKGYNGHISETANPENKLNLIVDVVETPNNVDDAAILEERLPEMLQKTPALDEYHSDGGYGSPTVDKIMEKNKIRQIQTAVRGRKAYAKFSINHIQEDEYSVTCEYGQIVKAEKAKKGKNAKRYKATFDHNTCLACPLYEICNSDIVGGKRIEKKRVWYFSEENILFHKRQQNIDLIPQERRKLRANVEATVKEMKRGIKNGKVRVRKQIKIRIYLNLTAISVNLTRIHKYLNSSSLSCLTEPLDNSLLMLGGVCGLDRCFGYAYLGNKAHDNSIFAGWCKTAA